MKRFKHYIYGIAAGALALTLVLGGTYIAEAAAETAPAGTVQEPGPGNGQNNPGNGGISRPPANDVDEQEIADLLWMREEEKVARDAYITLGEQWDVTVFANISQSEQQHMDAIATLLDRYGIEDPVVDDTVGVFTNPDLQALYDDLVAQGSASLEDALKVGATIEEVDIIDLQEAIADTDNADIQQVYESLMSGSENHLRAFVNTLEQMTGETYTPQFLDQATYDSIMAGTNGQNGNQGGRGSRGGRH